jgi:putative ABC transport system substrate-binding protein
VFITLLGGATAWPLVAHGQQTRRAWRIAFPEEGAGFAGATKRFDAFRNGLRELGYTDDNSIIDRRVANGRDELVALCQNMIAHGANVIVAGSSNLALAAQEATKTVPIVIRAAADPVAARLVASLARPGGNITGVTSQAADLSAKRLELLKQLLPQLHRVAILLEPNAAASRDSMRETEAAAHILGIQIESFGVNRAADLSATFQSIAAGQFDAIDVLASPIVTGNRTHILDF